MSTDSTTSPASPEPENSPAALLDSLVDVLLHLEPAFEKWLDAIRTPITDKSVAIGKIGEMIRLSARMRLEPALTERIITAVVLRDQLGWSAQKILEFVDGIYPDEQKREMNNERRRQGLPPLGNR